jgi:hypothetical protein
MEPKKLVILRSSQKEKRMNSEIPICNEDTPSMLRVRDGERVAAGSCLIPLEKGCWECIERLCVTTN